MGSLEVFSRFYSILLLGSIRRKGLPWFLAFSCVLATSRVILHAFVIDFFPCARLECKLQNHPGVENEYIFKHSNTQFEIIQTYPLVLKHSSWQFPTDDVSNYKLQFMESPSVVTRKFPSDMTRTRFLGYDACPRLWREVCFCVAGVALGVIDGPLVWHVLCMVTSMLRSCSFSSDLTRGVCLMRVHLCGAWWHRRCVSVAGAARKSSRVFYDAADRVRGRRASVWHRRSLCMARVVLGDRSWRCLIARGIRGMWEVGWLWCFLFVFVTLWLLILWQAWHMVT
jgi:hypothetical protein